MIRSNIVHTFLAAVCIAIPGAAFAQQREPVTAQVRYGDLNLATVSGQAAFKQRVHQMAARACGRSAGNVSLAEAMDEMRCTREIDRDGVTQLAVLASRPAARLAAELPK